MTDVLQQITVDVNPEVMDWLTKRALSEKCTVEDFASVVITAVCINSLLNQNQNEKEKIHETSHQDA